MSHNTRYVEKVTKNVNFAFLCDFTKKKGKKMRIRQIFNMIDCDLKKFNALDDALRSLIIDRERPVFEDGAMELTFTNLLRDLRDECWKTWNRYNKGDR